MYTSTIYFSIGSHAHQIDKKKNTEISLVICLEHTEWELQQTNIYSNSNLIVMQTQSKMILKCYVSLETKSTFENDALKYCKLCTLNQQHQRNFFLSFANDDESIHVICLNNSKKIESFSFVVGLRIDVNKFPFCKVDLETCCLIIIIITHAPHKLV